MKLMRLAQVPPVVVDLSASVSEAVQAMVENSVGAVAVVDGRKLRGIFSERDVMRKVIYHNLPPADTPVAEVMTKDVEAIAEEFPAEDALRIMVERHFRHLPIIDKDRNVLGMLSIRHLLQNQVEELADSVHSLASYIEADGPGG